MPESLKQLINSIWYLPGIWEKSATKLAFFLLNANKNYIENHRPLEFLWLTSKIIEIEDTEILKRKEIVLKYLDKLPWKKWFIYKNYSVWWTKKWEYERMYFSDENAMKCDAIRSKIENPDYLVIKNDVQYVYNY